jgi:hypothetical protein
VYLFCQLQDALFMKYFRKVWDNLMFYLILKPRARVPSRDTFVARRIAGPGLASSYFYQVPNEVSFFLLKYVYQKKHELK